MNNNKQSSSSTELSGSVKIITYHNEENGYCVLKVDTSKEKNIPVTGYSTDINVGEFIQCQGNWSNDKKFGLQFKASKISISTPTSLKGIEIYLGSGIIKGIGKSYAKKIVQEFGEETFDIIENDPTRLLEIKGIGKARIGKIINDWEDAAYIREVTLFFQEHHVGSANITKIYKKHGKNSIDKVKENPYALAKEVRGIGFKTADSIGLSMGIPKDSILRARSGVSHVLFELSSRGDICSIRANLVDEAVKILDIDSGIVNDAISIELKLSGEDRSIISETIDGIEYIYNIDLYYAEKHTAWNLVRLSKNKIPWRDFDKEKSIQWVQEKLNVKLSPSQVDSISLSLSHNISIITGGPGVGKTTVLNSLLKILQALNVNFLLCAPTGKAAKRMTEATGFESKTIHRLLGRGRDGIGFRFNRDNFLDADLIVIDEFSMVDIKLIKGLVEAISNRTGVIFVGDVDQLPSVGPGTVLRDMIDSKIIKTSKLDKIFRQASGSSIIKNAHLVNAGKMPEKQKDGEKSDFYLLSAKEPEAISRILKNVVTKRAKEGLGFDPIKDVQVLTPANNGLIGVRSLNYELQKALNPESKNKNQIEKFGTTYRVGDKVIQRCNNYDKSVFNGDSGFIVSIDLDNEILTVNFDENNVEYDFFEVDDLSLAYAMTIHKSQGSEYPCVVIPVSTQHFMLLERNLIYTGITRGKQTVIVICQYKALAIAVKKVSSKKRVGNLIYRLKEMFNK